MARRTKEQEQTPKVNAEFIYRKLMTHPAWPVVENAIDQLRSNDDLELQTASRYVVGFLIEQLIQHDLIRPTDISLDRAECIESWVSIKPNASKATAQKSRSRQAHTALK